MAVTMLAAVTMLPSVAVAMAVTRTNGYHHRNWLWCWLHDDHWCGTDHDRLCWRHHSWRRWLYDYRRLPLISPMTFVVDPLTAFIDPAWLDPVTMRGWRHDPVPSAPHVATRVPSPMPRYPDMSRRWHGRTYFDLGCRWCNNDSNVLRLRGRRHRQPEEQRGKKGPLHGNILTENVGCVSMPDDLEQEVIR